MSRNTLIHELCASVGEQYVLVEKEDVIVYEQDSSIFQVMPKIVVPGNVVGYGEARNLTFLLTGASDPL